MAGEGQIAEGQIGVSIDGNGIKGDVAQIVNSISEIDKAAARTGTKASQGLDKIGDGAINSANNVDRATKNITNSIERTIATIKAGGRGTSAFFESLANIRGADGAALKPYIEQLKAVEREAERAALSNTKLGNTAKQTAFALRSVPAQISDIVVSLQGGQAPLTVFLQQGAQLKDLFGGAGAAARALGGFVLGLISPFSLATAGAAALGAAYFFGSEQTDRLNKALIVSGNIAGGTVGTFTQLANDAGKLAGNYGLAREAVEALAGSGKFSGELLKTSLDGVIAGTQLTGRSVQELVKDFEAIAKNPSKAIADLNDKYNFVTADIYKQITALEKQGKTQEAATLSAKLYADTLTGRESEVVTSLGAIERGWATVKRVSDSAKDSILGVGRALSDAEKLEQAQSRLADLQRGQSETQSGRRGVLFAVTQEDVSAQEKLVTDLQRQQATAKFLAQDAAKFRQEQKAKISQQGVFDEYVGADSRTSKSGLVAKQIEDENKAFALATKGFQQNSAEFQLALAAHEQAIKNIQDKSGAADNKKAESIIQKLANSYKSAKEQAEGFIRTQQQELAQQEPLTAAQREAAKLIDLITNKKIALGGVEQKNLETLAQQILAVGDLTAAQKLELQFIEDYEKGIISQEKALRDQLGALAASADELEVQNQVYGKLPSAITEVTLARLNDKKVMLESLGLAVGDIEEQIDAYNRLRAAQTNKEFLEAEDERRKDRVKAEKQANEEIIRDEKRAAEERSRIIGDSLVRGFERGGSIKKTLQDTLTNISKTLVVRPVIDFVLNASGLNSILSYVSKLFSQTGVVGSAASGGLGSIGSLTQLSGLFKGGIVDAFKTGGGILDVFSGGNNAIVGSIEKLGVLISNGNGGILDAVGGFLGANAGSISSGLPYAGSIVQALQGDIKGAAFTAVGTAIGGPIGGIIGGVVGSLFGGKKIPLVGSQASGIFDGTQYLGTTNKLGKKDIGLQDSLASVNEAFSSSLGFLLKEFGLNSSIFTGSAFRTRTNLRGFFDASFDGGSVTLAQKYGKAKGNNAEAGFQQYIATVLGSTLVEAIQKSKLSDSIKSLFNNVTDKEVVGALINSAVALNTAQIGLADTYGLTVNKAADAAAATGLFGKDLAEFVSKLTAASLTLGDAIVIQRANLLDEIGTVPNSLKEFDALLKSIDKSTDVGVQRFSDLFTIRDQVIQFTKDMAGLKGGVSNALLGIVNPAEQRTILQENLKTIFDDVGLAIPTSIDGLIDLGKSIDFTTKEGVNLAAVFPSLVSAFTQTKDVIDQLTASSLRGKEAFRTAADFMDYQAVAGNYGAEFANDYTANFDTGRILNDASGNAVVAADPTLDLVAEVKKLVAIGLQGLIDSGTTASKLRKFDEVGFKLESEGA